jgi:type II secretory ATPase GspE/PulE/Tfp pilus assembly ATPase PilB-like protein
MAVQFNEESQGKLDAIRRKEEEDLVIILSQKYGIGHVNLREALINTEALRLLKEEVARKHEVVSFRLNKKEVSLAIRTPNSSGVQQVIRELEGRGYKVTPYMTSQNSLDYAWEHYKDLSFATATQAGVMDVSPEEVAKLMDQLKTLGAVRDAVVGVADMERVYRITRTLEIILAGALAHDASDVHIEPTEESTRLRYRLDGVLVTISDVEKETYQPLLTRIKLLSGLKINIKDAAQDGRFSMHLGGREIELRVSVMPGGNGESVVMRLLDPQSIRVSLEALGMRQELLEKLAKELEKPNGMILNTGPTGSGKTTTLYAFLKQVSNPKNKVLTIEDPIEYHLKGIVQTQVNHKDYTFASGLRSALRQDPDVIMVGEIRDAEVAETAVHAALTGHLVFSTLHTNNAAGSFPRLINLGVQASMLGSAVNASMAQRLLRTLIPERRKEVPIEGKDRELVDRALDTIHDKSQIPDNVDTMWVPDVPEGEIGYKGRIAVYETFFMTRAIEDAVRQDLTIRELEDVAREDQGFMSMREDAVVKVLNGITTLDEVRRVLGVYTEE